jgi:hypothetical protein
VSSWLRRPKEEAYLFNPAYCAALVRLAADGYAKVQPEGLPFELAFVILPVLLHEPTRASLPRTRRTSFVAWAETKPLVRVGARDRIAGLVPTTREAVLFGAVHRMFQVRGARVVPCGRQFRVKRSIREATADTSAAFKRAEFLGDWLARAGSSATVFALLGVQP